MRASLSVSEAAKRLRVAPRLLSDLLYWGKLDGRLCPIVAGRRLVPVSYLPAIRAVLRRRGQVSRRQQVSALEGRAAR